MILFDIVKIDLFFIEYTVWNGSTDVKATQKRLTELREFFKKIGGDREIHTGNLDVVFVRIWTECQIVTGFVKVPMSAQRFSCSDWSTL